MFEFVSLLSLVVLGAIALGVLAVLAFALKFTFKLLVLPFAVLLVVFKVLFFAAVAVLCAVFLPLAAVLALVALPLLCLAALVGLGVKLAVA